MLYLNLSSIKQSEKRMADLEKMTVDTLVKPEADLDEQLKLEGSSDEQNQNQFIGGDEVDLLGDGVQGYETTGEAEPNDSIANSLMKPKP